MSDKTPLENREAILLVKEEGRWGVYVQHKGGGISGTLADKADNFDGAVAIAKHKYALD